MLHAIPAVVTVHGEVTADHGGETTLAQTGEQGVEQLDGGLGGARRYVTAIQEGVEVDLLGATLGGHLDHAHDVLFVAVYATRGHQTHDVNGLALGHGSVDSLGQLDVLEEVAVLDVLGDAGQLLIDDATGTDVGVAHFGVAHLAVRQTHVQAGAGDQGAGVVTGQAVQVRGLGGSDGVVLLLGAVAPTVHDDQNQRFLSC